MRETILYAFLRNLLLPVESMGGAHCIKLACYALNDDARDASDKHAGKVGDKEGSPGVL